MWRFNFLQHIFIYDFFMYYMLLLHKMYSFFRTGLSRCFSSFTARPVKLGELKPFIYSLWNDAVAKTCKTKQSKKRL